MSNLLTTPEAAEELGLKPNTLERWRSDDTRPDLAYLKIGGRVLYERRAIELFRDRCRVTRGRRA